MQSTPTRFEPLLGSRDASAFFCLISEDRYLMKTDDQLKKDVILELRWDPTVTFTDVNVAAKKGVITLSGTVPHYAEKWAAERATQRVRVRSKIT